MADICPAVGKRSWPEYRGWIGETVKCLIEDENPALHVELVMEGTQVTQDVQCDRVRVWINWIHVVTRTPVIG